MMSALNTEKQSKYPPSRTAGLIPFKAGQSGNPGGIRKGTIIVSEAYKRLGAMSVEELRTYEPREATEMAIRNAILRACEAEDWQAAHAALKEIADRTEGKAVQQRVIIDTSDQAALIREAKTRFSFFIEYNQRFTQYRQLFADHFQMDAETLPDFEVCSIERIIEIVAGQFPEAARQAVMLEM